jgi:hypothetical protein
MVELGILNFGLEGRKKGSGERWGLTLNSSVVFNRLRHLVSNDAVL